MQVYNNFFPTSYKLNHREEFKTYD